MSKKVNLSQIKKIVKLVDKQDYSFADAGRAVGLCSKTARKYYWEYTEPKVEEKPERELQEQAELEKKKAEEKRKLLESLDRKQILPTKPAIDVANRPRTSEESGWKLMGIIALIGVAIIAALTYFKKPEKVIVTQEQPKEKTSSQRRTVTFNEYRPSG